MVTGGANLGRIGVITNRERHPGSFDVVHVKDANGNSFATRLSNIFVIGKVSLHGRRAGGFSPVVGGCWLKAAAFLHHEAPPVLASVLALLPVVLPAPG